MDEFADQIISGFNQSEKKYLFDVGANNGEQLRHWWKNKAWEFHLFEPTPELYDLIADKIVGCDNVRLYPIAVSDINSEVEFNVSTAGEGGCSSLYEFDKETLQKWISPEFVVSRKIKVVTDTLKYMLEVTGIPTIDYLHVDTQGNDLLVLKGLGDRIKDVRAGQVEASTDLKLYTGSPTEEEMKAFLEENGFKIWHVHNYPHECNIYFRRD